MPPRISKKKTENREYKNIYKIYKYYDSKIPELNGHAPGFNILLSELYFQNGNKNRLSVEFMYDFLHNRLGLSSSKISNIVSQILQIKNLEHCSFQAIINQPFNFTRGKYKVFSFNQAQKICNVLNIDVGIYEKCISWVEHHILNTQNSIWRPVTKILENLEDIVKRGFNPRESPDTNLPANFDMDFFRRTYLKCIQKINTDKPHIWYATSRQLYEIEREINQMMRNIFFEQNEDEWKIKPSCYRVADSDLNSLITNFQSENNITFKPAQIDAVKGAINNKLSVIIGQPGTGKSTIAECITYCLYKIGCQHISLTAISGMAVGAIKSKCYDVSQKDKDLCGTMDKLLFTIYPNKKMHEMPDVIIIDEFSMVDIFKWHQILKHLSANTAQVIIIGDYFQLPSIGPGNLLKTITDNQRGIFRTYKLTDIMRQTGSLSQIIKDMTIRNITEADFNDSDFIFKKFDGNNPELFIETLILQYNLNPNTSRFLCSQTKGKCGIDNVNKILQNIHNPHGQIIEGGTEVLPNSENNYDGNSLTKFRINDLIMRTNNNYLKDDNCVYLNGDVGHILPGDKPKSFNIMYDDNSIDGIKLEEININELHEVFTLSYAISVHKSQGSQYDTVIIMMTPDQQFMWCDEKCDGFKLLYTAISRAKLKCIIVGDMKIFKSAQSQWSKTNNNRISICARPEYMFK